MAKPPTPRAILAKLATLRRQEGLPKVAAHYQELADRTKPPKRRPRA